MSTLTKSAESTIKTQSIIEAGKNRFEQTNFLVLTNEDGIADWLLESKVIKFDAIRSERGDKPTQFPLRNTQQGNADAGRDAKDGKALHYSVENAYVIIKIYTHTYGADTTWKYSHQHRIKKTLFDAYLLVTKNTLEVLETEKVAGNEENFDMGLEKAS